MGKKPWHKGNYDVRSRRLVAAAYADPTTRCWRCGRTLAQHPNTKSTDKPPRWSAGHVNTGEVGGLLLPEVLTCNAAHGAAYGNRRRKSRRTMATHQRATQPPIRTDLTW